MPSGRVSQAIRGDEKCCSKCSQWKNMKDNFYKTPNRPGYRSVCIQCSKEVVYEWNRNNPEKVAAWQRDYYKRKKEKFLNSIQDPTG